MFAKILVSPLQSCHSFHNLGRRSKCPCQSDITSGFVYCIPSKRYSETLLAKLGKMFSPQIVRDVISGPWPNTFFSSILQAQGEDRTIMGTLSSYWLWAILVQCVLQSRIAYFLGNKVRISIQHCHFLCSLYESLWRVFDREI